MLRVIKQRYFDKLNPQRREFLSEISDYDHLSKGNYLRYLFRKPKSVYKNNYLSMQKQGYRIKDQGLIDVANLKLQSLEKEFTDLNGQVHIKSKEDYNPTFISVIMSHNFEPESPKAYIHYQENMIKESLDLPWYYLNSYGAYHDDTFHQHSHLVLFQDEKFYKRKEINHFNSKFYINKKQLKTLKKLQNYHYQYDLLPQFDKDTVIENLITIIKHYKNPHVYSKRKEFTIDLLLNILGQKFKNDNQLIKLKKIMYKYKNYTVSHNKEVDFSALVENSRTFSTSILKNKLKEKMQLEKENFYLNIIKQIRNDSIKVIEDISKSIIKAQIKNKQELFEKQRNGR